MNSAGGKEGGGSKGSSPEWTAAKTALAALLLARAAEAARNASWDTLATSAAFSAYRASCAKLLAWGGPGYTPLLADGVSRQSVPSKSKQVFIRPPLSPEQCVSLTPWRLRGLTLRNRVIRAAAFDGVETREMLKMHESLAAGGVGMTVIAYCSVAPEGRTFDGQIVLRDVADARARLRPVTDAVHRHGAAICAQLTHAGSFAHREVIGTQQISASAVFNPAGFDWPRAATKADIERLIRDFAFGANVVIRECGFDAVEVHCGHGYLLSQWMSPRTNVRTDEYGGSPENRARLACRVIRAVREVVGSEVPILVKMNAQDGVYGGLELPDALVMAELFAEASADLIVVTTGFVSLNGFYMLRGAAPVDKLVMALPGHAMKLATLVFGPLVVPAIPYEDCFMRDHAREVLARLRRTHPNVGVCLMGGVASLGEMEGAMAEGFAAVQMARPLIREPDFLQRMTRELLAAKPARAAAIVGGSEAQSEDDFDVESKCIRCNSCVISSVDPNKDIGCPFRKLEEANQGRTLSISPAQARVMWTPDIEECVRGSRI